MILIILESLTEYSYTEWWKRQVDRAAKLIVCLSEFKSRKSGAFREAWSLSWITYTYIWKQGHFEFQLSKTIDWASSGTMWACPGLVSRGGSCITWDGGQSLNSFFLLVFSIAQCAVSAQGRYWTLCNYENLNIPQKSCRRHLGEGGLLRLLPMWPG